MKHFSDVSKLARRSALVVITAAAFALAAPAAVQASTVDLTQTAPFPALLAFWEENNLDPAVIDSLTDGMEIGIVPDSVSLANEPIDVANRAEGASVITTSTYPDGSISVTSAESTSGVGVVDPQGRAIAGCGIQTYTGVTYRTDCKVSGTNGAISISFYAPYTIQHQGMDSIPNAGHSPAQACASGCSTPALSLHRATETSALLAALTYSTHWEVAGWASKTFFLSLVVGGNSAYSQMSA